MVVGTNPATLGHVAKSEVERGQNTLQYAIEALEHAVKWNGIAHLRAEKAKALLEELARLREMKI